MDAICGGSGFWTFHKCGHLIRNCVTSCVPVKSNSTYKYRRSTSLQLVRKKKRDSERMSTFMRKKDAQNLPFYELETDELQKLGFNSLSRISDKCRANFKKSLVSLETTVNSQTACISFLKVHNNDLKVSAVVNSEKCDKLSRQVDSLTETNKRLVKLKEKHLEELDRAQLKRMKNQSCIANLQLDCQKKQSVIDTLANSIEQHQKDLKIVQDEVERRIAISHKDLEKEVDKNALLEHQLETVKSELEQIYCLILIKDNKDQQIDLEQKLTENHNELEKEINKNELLEKQLKTVQSDLEQEIARTKLQQATFKEIIDSATKEMEFMSTQLDFGRVKPVFGKFGINEPPNCNKCGSQYHRAQPGKNCKLGHEYSRYYKTKCGSCDRPGHFTLMCHHLKKLL